MGLFRYACPACGEFEIILVSHREFFECPRCGRVSPQILSQTAPPQFKTSGFHAVDYGAKYKGS